MLPGFTPALLGEGLTFAPPFLGVDQFTKSLMKFDGWYGSTLTGPALIDYAKPSRVWTSGGSTNILQALRYSGTALYMDGSATSGAFSPAGDPDYDIVPGQDFTIDFWVVSAAPATNGLCLLTKSPASNYAPFLFYQNGGQLTFYSSSNSSSWDIASAQVFGAATNQIWVHLAVQRKGNVWTGYYNGAQAFTFTSALNPFVTTATPVGLGVYSTSKLSPFNGYFDELRFSSVARYSGNFTPSWNPYFPSLNGSNDAATRLLLHAEDMNDRSAGCALRGSHPVYFNGTAVISTAQAKFGNKSFKFDGSVNCIVWVPTVHAADLHPLAGDWTVDFWYYRVGGSGQVIGPRDSNSQYADWLIVDNGTNFFLYSSQSGNAWDIYNANDLGAIPSGQWVHFALVHANGLPAASALRSFVNGALAKSYNFTQGTSLGFINNNFCIGGATDIAGPSCYMDEIRYSSVARWTANFTPPTAPYGPDTDPTVLLMHFDGANGSTALSNSSPSAHGNAGNQAVTISNVQSKFGGTSALFNGSNAYCYFPYSPDWDFGNGDWTIDYWEYRTANTAAQAVICRDAGLSYSGFLIGYNAGATLNFYASRDNASWGIASAVSMGPVVLNQWHHFAVVRKGNVFTTYRDGVPISQVTSALACGATSDPIYIGYYSGNFFPGYIDELRISRCARWTSQFTPPAAPYTGTETVSYPDANTLLLLHFDGGQAAQALMDSSAYNRSIGIAGGYQTWAAIAKFGPTSGTFNTNNSNDCCYVASALTGGDPAFAFGTGDFTIDLWVNVIGSQFGWIYDGRLNTSVVGVYPGIYITATNTITFCHANNGPLDRIVGTTVLAGGATVWNHIAVVRSAGVTKLYINGVAEGVVYTDPNTYLSGANRPLIGGNNAGNQFRGYIDELRVSNIARWTASFTPPTAPYS